MMYLNTTRAICFCDLVCEKVLQLKGLCSLAFISSHGVLFDAAPRKGTSPGGRSSGVAQMKKPFSRCRHVPWRAAARAGRQR